MIITSKYNGLCASCGNAIRKGEKINWTRGSKPTHANCSSDTYGHSVAYYFTGSGETMYQNSRGRCEDAPCCGCCS